MKKSELRQLIREVISEVEGDSYEISGLNIRFNFIVSDTLIQYDRPERRNWLNGAVNKVEYNKESDFLTLSGEYSVEIDYEKKRGEFFFHMKNFVKGGQVATAQTTGDGILRGFWQNNKIYDYIPDSKDRSRGGMDTPIFIPDAGMEFLAELRHELPKNPRSLDFKNLLKKLERRYRPTL